MPLSELHGALGKKIIDGTLAPTSAIYDFKLENLIRHSARLNVYTAPMVVVMNREKFNSLPDDAKKAIEKASGREWGIRAARLYDKLDTDTVTKMNASGKIRIYSLPAVEIRKHMDRVKVMEAEWIEKAVQKGLSAKEMMEALHRSIAGNRAK
jgi:TRAP-type C4-dicarboxylate transport system substrate-binding protein